MHMDETGDGQGANQFQTSRQSTDPEPAVKVALPTLPRDLPAPMLAVLQSAAHLQRIVPDATLVGGTAAVVYAGHRLSYDHDHVVIDLRDRFDAILEALERECDFVLNRQRAGKIILGQIGDIETGVRQLIRTRPLETQRFQLPSGEELAVPTLPEILRVKGFLVVKRNQTRDYLDTAALAERYGIAEAANTLGQIDDYYTDDTKPVSARPVRDQLRTQLADPRPADAPVTERLSHYKGLAARWHDWGEVTRVLCQVSSAMGDATGREER